MGYSLIVRVFHGQTFTRWDAMDQPRSQPPDSTPQDKDLQMLLSELGILTVQDISGWQVVAPGWPIFIE